MSGLKNTVDRLKGLEAEKINLLSQVEDLKRVIDAKADTLEDEIAALRKELSSLQSLVGTPKNPSRPYSKEANLLGLKGFVDKFVGDSERMGSQIFSDAPFSQNYDGWLAEVRHLVSSFEENCAGMVDEEFRGDCSRVVVEVEGALTKKKAEQANAGDLNAALAENSRLLADAEALYVEKEKELAAKRDAETLKLVMIIHELEGEVEKLEDTNGKRKLLKKRTDDKLPQAKQDLKDARNSLETVKQNYASERDKLQVEVDAKKQELTLQVDSLRKELSSIEADTSMESRQQACRALVNAVNALVDRASSVA
ncbi:MAG: hypothetical protein NWE93_03280 [Candidatus Bathyarchaeota archaeon]|nr:hypothetical protein [Candidatus Bathyarchaeota archaeon]